MAGNELLRIEGGDSLQRAKAQLAGADKVLKRHVTRNMKDATRPLQAAVVMSASSKLPSRGGLARSVASRIKVTTSVTWGGKQARAKIKASDKKWAVKKLDMGVNAHPVWPKKGQPRYEYKWVTQPVTPGWFTKPIEARLDTVRASIVTAVDDMTKEVNK